MARAEPITEQTARRSTGGRAPWFQLVTPGVLSVGQERSETAQQSQQLGNGDGVAVDTAVEWEREGEGGGEGRGKGEVEGEGEGA